MPRERVSANLRWVPVAPVTCIAVRPVLEQDVTELVRTRALMFLRVAFAAGPAADGSGGPAAVDDRGAGAGSCPG